MAATSSKRYYYSSVFAVFMASFILQKSSYAYQFNVGSRAGWIVNPPEDYNHWAGRLRFQVNDTLLFKYPKGSNSVLEVNRDGYSQCNVDNPILKMEDGNSIFKFDRSGPFYFISGNKTLCDRGQKIIIVVLAIRNRPPPVTPAPAGQPPSLAPAPVPTSPSPSPAGQPPWLAPAPVPTSPSPSPAGQTPSLAPAPVPTSPSPSPAGQTPSLAPAPASLTPAPSVSPISPSPASTPVSPTGSPPSPPLTPPGSVTPPGSITSPPPGGNNSGNINSPPSPSGASAFTASTTVLVAAVSIVFTLV